MPYQNEHASPLGHVPIMVKEREAANVMRRWQRVATSNDTKAIAHLLHDVGDLPVAPAVNLAIAVDGSPAFVNDHGAKLAFYQIGTVAIDIDGYIGAAGERGQTVDRTALRKSVNRSQLVLQLPCGGYVPAGRAGDEADLWRSEVFEQFRAQTAQMMPGAELSLLDGLMLVHGGPRRPALSLRVPRCRTARSKISKSPLGAGPAIAVLPCTPQTRFAASRTSSRTAAPTVLSGVSVRWQKGSLWLRT